MKSAKISMKRRTIVIDGIHYYAERPHDCRKCFFWKNRKVGCSLGSENCYYLAEIVKTEQEKKCENCPYYQPDFKYRKCLYARCPYQRDTEIFRRRPLKMDKIPGLEVVKMDV